MPVALDKSDIEIETLDGDALGDPRDTFSGEGTAYHYLFYIPDGRVGSSKISVSVPGVDVASVVVAYDTLGTIDATFGVPIQRNNKTEIPVAFDAEVEILHKRVFEMSRPVPFQIYRQDDMNYSLVLQTQNTDGLIIAVSGSVRKAGGIPAEITPLILEL